MTTLRGDILNRVRRLPKPSQASEALQPLFEAISNSLHAIEDKYGEDYQSNGLIVVTIINHNKPDAISIVVADDGVGIDDARFEAFCTTDTDYKIGRGGKGVGRLLWLDAFERISVKSVFERGPDTYQRSFSFQLSASEQIVDEEVLSVPRSTPTGTIITFTGIRNGPYRDKFTTQPATFVKHLGSHFFADFILGQSSSVAVDIDGATTYFPEAITSLLVENRGLALIETPEYGILRLSSFICNKSASANFEGLHQIHLVANGRTVSTRKIDGLLGIGRFGEDGDRVFHGCAAGDFLNDRVNQERTQFNFDETVAEDLVRKCALYAREHILRSEIEDFDSERLVTMKDFLAEYPSFGFDAPEELLVRTPKNAIKAEQFAQALIPIRIRRDKERSDRVRDVVRQIADGTLPSADIAQLVRYAANDVRAEEQRQLTEYVLRRKVALDVLDVLIRRVRELDDGTDHHLESTLHQFICPMRVRGDDPEKIERSDHDLWVVDERLTFARYFASDVSFRQIVEESRSKERMDTYGRYDI
jgi:hypothetical protein